MLVRGTPGSVCQTTPSETQLQIGFVQGTEELMMPGFRHGGSNLSGVWLEQEVLLKTPQMMVMCSLVGELLMIC